MAIILLPIFLLACSRLAEAGGGSEVGNGGDTIFCVASQQNSFSGYFTLDYLLEYRNTSEYGELAPVASWSHSKERLLNIIQRLYPEIFPHFSEFVNLIENTSDPGAHRVWVPRSLGLEDIKDENITRALPENCLDRRGGSPVPQITQTVIRKMWNPQIIYEFDPEVLKRQKHDNPLQYSFFMVHEWLWDITDQVDSIRKVNWLLHSRRIESMTSDEFQRIFRSFGLFNRKLSVCQRSEALKKGLSRIFGNRDCESITTDELRTIQTLDLSALSIRFPFRVGDLYGFDGLERLKMSENPEVFGFLYPEFFSPLYSLKALDLSSSNLTVFTQGLSRGLRYLEALDLSQNPLETISPAFSFMSGLKNLKLSVFRPSLFSELAEIRNLPPALETLDLSFNEAQRRRKGEIIRLIHSVRPRLQITSD